MSRFIAVMSTGRSGSSMVAGMLHYAGVHMGSHLAGTAPYNPKGIFEDVRFYELNHSIAAHVDACGVWRFDTTERFPHNRHRPLSDLIAEYERLMRQEEQPIYGLKEPLLAVAWQYVKDVIPGEKRIIIVHRKWSSSIRSMMNVRGYIEQYQMTQAQIERMYALILMHIYDIVYTAEFPVLHVQYGDILNDPINETKRILHYVSDGLNVSMDMNAALSFVSPKLCHHA